MEQPSGLMTSSNGNCQFGNKKCLCQFCKAECSKRLTCLECISERKTVHDITKCTKFEKETTD